MSTLAITENGTATKGTFTGTLSGGREFTYYGVRYSQPYSEANPQQNADWYDNPTARDQMFDQFARGETVPKYAPNAEWVWTEDASDAPEVSPEVAALQRQVELLSARLATAQAPITDPSDERVAGIWERAAGVASEEGFCREYDRLAEGMGIPGRSRLFRGVVSVTFNVYAYAEGHDEDEAREAMEERVRSQLRDDLTVDGPYDEREDGHLSHLDIDNSEVSDVNPYR